MFHQKIFPYIKAFEGADGKLYYITYYADGHTDFHFEPCPGKKVIDFCELDLREYENKLSEFKSIESTYKFDIYLNDTIDDIISCIPYKYLSEINNVLKATYDRYSTYANVLGASEDIKSLMVNNNFMYNFRSIYNIYQVNWPVVYDDKLSHNSNGNIILNNKQVKFLEDMLQKHIDNINVIEYDKDINVKDIINYNHILISDSTEKIYLITYDIISDYPIDEDILKTLHLNV